MAVSQNYHVLPSLAVLLPFGVRDHKESWLFRFAQTSTDSSSTGLRVCSADGGTHSRDVMFTFVLSGPLKATACNTNGTVVSTSGR